MRKASFSRTPQALAVAALLFSHGSARGDIIAIPQVYQSALTLQLFGTDSGAFMGKIVNAPEATTQYIEVHWDGGSH